MKVLVIVPMLHCGGVARTVSKLTHVWQKTHNVLIAVFDVSKIAYSYGGTQIDLKCPPVNGTWFKLTNIFRRFFRLTALIWKEKPDRIISFMESANFPAILAASLTGTLSSLSVSVRSDPKIFMRAHKCLMPLLYRFPNRVIAISQGVSLALEKMGIPRQKLSFIPNPPPLQNELKIAGETDNIRRPPHYILGVGRLSPEKGFERLMAAFAGIDDPDLHLVILGEGAERANLETLAEELKISARFMMPGAVENVAPWFQNALCFVLSSRYEGWGNVLVEAMYYRCPAVSFDCCYGPNEIREHEVSGLLVPEGDVHALRSAIVKVVSNDALRKQFVEESLRRLEQFDVKEIAEKWIL